MWKCANVANRLDLDFSGQIDSEQMSRALDEMVELAADFENGKLLYRIGEFQLPTMGAIGVNYPGCRNCSD